MGDKEDGDELTAHRKRTERQLYKLTLLLHLISVCLRGGTSRLANTALPAQISIAIAATRGRKNQGWEGAQRRVELQGLNK